MVTDANTCPHCGKASSGTTGCAYCLLQLGLSGGSPSVATKSALSQFGSRAGTATNRFVRQGVLPQFGDYELESEIARGGMGVVYRARQKSLNRTVAIKMILAGQLATPESVQRFRMEAEAAARLHHPGIVPIFEIGEHETQHFFSMELVEGVSLAECIGDFRLQENAPTAERAEQERCIAELIAKVARALEFAHQRGVLHRDLKPSNILIDEELQPRLTDFGLAKLTGREMSGLTLSSAVLGTPGYLAPEQAAGRPDEVTTSADVYGLGATLYELLTGRPPFVGSTAVETMMMAIDRDPTPPRQLNPAVSRDLETIALRCIERSPKDRYPSAAAVADELERFLRGDAILARPVSLGEQIWRWCGRNPHLALLSSALLIAIVVGSGAAVWQWFRAEQANLTLQENVAHLEWEAIDGMVAQKQASRALAKVAALLRADPHDWKAAMFAMSLLEQRRYPLAISHPIRHPEGAELTVARVSYDSKRAVTGSYDGTARLWDPLTSQQIGEPLRHDGPVTWAAFNYGADGSNLVATCSDDKTVRLWNTSDGTPVGKPYVHDEPVVHLEFAHRGAQFLMTRTKHTVAILAGDSGEEFLPPMKHEGTIVAARVSGNYRYLYTAESNPTNAFVRVWSLTTGKEVGTMKFSSLRDASVDDDLLRIAWIDVDGRAYLADFPTKENRVEIKNPTNRFERIYIGRTGFRVATISNNNCGRVWDASSAAPISPEMPHYYLLNGALMLGGGQRLLTWAEDSLAQVWDADAGRLYCEPMRHANRVVFAENCICAGNEAYITTVSHLKSRSAETRTGAAQVWQIHSEPNYRVTRLGRDEQSHDGGAVSPNGKIVALGKTSQEVHLLDSATGKEIGPPLSVRGSPWGLLFTPDGERLIVTTSVGQVSIWSIPAGDMIGEPVEIGAMIQPAEISRDGRLFATGSIDGKARLWSSATGQVLFEMKHGSEINSVAFSPDGTRLASAGEDRVVRIWDTATGKQVVELRGHQNEVLALRYRHDGKRLVTASLDFTARVWDAETGRELFSLPHQGEVLDAGYNPDGTRVATASRDQTAMLWDAETGRPASRPLIHEQGVRNVQFTPDGTQLLTQDFRFIRLWDVATGHPLTVPIPQALFGGTGFQSSSGRPSFFPSGKSVLVGMDAREAAVWHFTIPPPGAPAWFPPFLEAIAAQRYVSSADPSQTDAFLFTVQPQVVSPENFLEVARQIDSSQEKDFYTEWTKRWIHDGGEAKPSNAELVPVRPQGFHPPVDG